MGDKNGDKNVGYYDVYGMLARTHQPFLQGGG
jgi:hypothetical protein